jgi:hypothetical protein
MTSVTVPVVKTVSEELAAVSPITAKEDEVDGAYDASPLYCADSEIGPVMEEPRVRVAMPAVMVAEPRAVWADVKVTVPVGVPVVAEATVAVRVVLLLEMARVVVVASLAAVSGVDGEVLGRSVLSPG